MQQFYRFLSTGVFLVYVLVLFISSGKANMKDFHRMTFGHQDPNHLVLLIFKRFSSYFIDTGTTNPASDLQKVAQALSGEVYLHEKEHVIASPPILQRQGSVAVVLHGDIIATLSSSSKIMCSFFLFSNLLN